MKAPKTARQPAGTILFVIGFCVPVLLLLVGQLIHQTSGWNPSEPLAKFLTAIVWVIWPSWILMIDAEHMTTIIAMLLFSCLINGVGTAHSVVLLACSFARKKRELSVINSWLVRKPETWRAGPVHERERRCAGAWQRFQAHIVAMKQKLNQKAILVAVFALLLSKR